MESKTIKRQEILLYLNTLQNLAHSTETKHSNMTLKILQGEKITDSYLSVK